MTRPVPFLLLAAVAAPAAWGQDDAAPLTAGLNAQREVRQAAEAALEAKLARTAAELYGPEGVQLKSGITLDEALERLAGPAGVVVRPDRKALDIDGIELEDIILDAGFDIPADSRVSLRTTLELLLEGSGEELTVVNRSGVLLVTTVAEAELKLVTRTYDVADLARKGDAACGGGGVGRPTTGTAIGCSFTRLGLSCGSSGWFAARRLQPAHARHESVRRRSDWSTPRGIRDRHRRPADVLASDGS